MGSKSSPSAPVCSHSPDAVPIDSSVHQVLCKCGPPSFRWKYTGSQKIQPSSFCRNFNKIFQISTQFCPPPKKKSREMPDTPYHPYFAALFAALLIVDGLPKNRNRTETTRMSANRTCTELILKWTALISHQNTYRLVSTIVVIKNKAR